MGAESQRTGARKTGKSSAASPEDGDWALDLWKPEKEGTNTVKSLQKKDQPFSILISLLYVIIPGLQTLTNFYLAQVGNQQETGMKMPPKSSLVNQ